MDLTAELMAVERAAWDANLAGDGAFYDRMLRDDAIAVSPWGVQDKADAVATITANENPFTGCELDRAQSRRLGADGALITYRAVVRGESGGVPFQHTVYATSVYARENGRWRSVLHQQSLLANQGT